LVVIVECDLLDEAPMMALAVRQGWRNGAKIYLVNSHPAPQGEGQGEGNVLPFEFTRVTNLGDIPLSEAARPVIICGVNQSGIDAIQSASINGVKLAFIMDGPNAFGCALLVDEHEAMPLSRAIADKRVKGIISFETDLSYDLPEGIRVIGAADWQPTGLLARAEVVLPTCVWVEQGGTFVNNEGRAQRFKQVMQPGLPIKGLTPELHPPRVHRHDAPGGDVLPAWRIMTALLERLGGGRIEDSFARPWGSLAELTPEHSGILFIERKQTE
jgi:NADH-quinone oxidoreductase subunit G